MSSAKISGLFAIDPRCVGAVNDDLQRTASLLTHVSVNFEAINAGSKLHDLALSTLAEREAPRTPETGWAAHLPKTLRGPNVSDDARANYYGMLIAIDYRHWTNRETAQDERPAPYEPLAPQQFWYLPQQHAATIDASAASGAWVRGSEAMTTSLRDAVDFGGLQWFSPAVLVDPSDWNLESVRRATSYKLQPIDAPKPMELPVEAVQSSWPTCSLPSLEERVRMLQELGQTLVEHNASFMSLVKASNGRLYNNGEGFIERLWALHPRYHDLCVLDGATVYLMKLAQLTAIALMDARHVFDDSASLEFVDAHLLHVAPDYQLPKSLRSNGLLTYTDRLARLVETHCHLPEGSAEEIDIRVGSMVAARALQLRLAHITGREIPIGVVDYVLWLTGRSASALPHHLTVTNKY